MKYIVNSKEVSRNTFYFCKKAKEENKSFVLLKHDNPDEIENFISDNLEYDYYVCDNLNSYYVKGEKTTEEWFEKYRGAPKYTIDDLKKKFEKSKCRTSTFEKWCTKNDWEHKIETKYNKECFDIPEVEDFEEEDAQTKLFSVIVTKDNTINTINEIRKECGILSIEYVLRDGDYTEIIYADSYLEI